jgi:hypothetical protein
LIIQNRLSKKQLIKMGGLCLIATLSTISSVWASGKAPVSVSEGVVIPNSIDLVVSDMKGEHQARLDAVSPDCTWCLRPRLNYGNDPSRGHYSVFQFWGIVYLEAGTEIPDNVRVEIRNIRAYYLSKRDSTWHVLQKDASMEGMNYPGDFKGNPIPSNTRLEVDGSRSITMIKGYNYHFWPLKAQKVKIDTTDIGGIFTTYQARLILDDPKGPDNIGKAKFMAQSGGDYYLSKPTGKGNPVDNDDVGMGRFKYLTPNWQSFNMHTLNEAEIRKNPPPLD